MSTIFEEAQKAVEEDDAEVIILGCGFMTGAVTKLQKKLGVPIVDPVIAGIKVAEMLAELHRKIGLTHSKVCAYHPLEKFDCSP
jgi:allantoin racemase